MPRAHLPTTEASHPGYDVYLNGERLDHWDGGDYLEVVRWADDAVTKVGLPVDPEQGLGHAAVEHWDDPDRAFREDGRFPDLEYVETDAVLHRWVSDPDAEDPEFVVEIQEHDIERAAA